MYVKDLICNISVITAMTYCIVCVVQEVCSRVVVFAWHFLCCVYAVDILLNMFVFRGYWFHYLNERQYSAS